MVRKWLSTTVWNTSGNKGIGGKQMIKVKNRNYYLCESELKLETLTRDSQGRYLVKDRYNNIIELDKEDYRKLGGVE